mgnify:CR=1 FL=1
MSFTDTIKMGLIGAGALGLAGVYTSSLFAETPRSAIDRRMNEVFDSAAASPQQQKLIKFTLLENAGHCEEIVERALCEKIRDDILGLAYNEYGKPETYRSESGAQLLFPAPEK